MSTSHPTRSTSYAGVYHGYADYPGNICGWNYFRSPPRRWSPSLTTRETSESCVVPTDPLTDTTRLEAVLLLAREPLGIRRLAQLTGSTDLVHTRGLIRELNQIYDEQGFAFRVVNVAGGYQLVTREIFASWLRRLHGVQAEVRLSPSAMETLAVVAYRQPVLRTGIEAIRGVQCSEMLRQLMERDLVKIVGRSEELGRPFYYGTTRRFLQIFGLRSLRELPDAERFRMIDEDDDGTDHSSVLDHALPPSSLSFEDTNDE